MKPLQSALVVLICIAFANHANCNEFESHVGGGPWLASLPDYEIGHGNGFPFSDDMVNVGGILRVDSVYRFTGTRTSFETSAFFAGAASDKSTGPITMENPNGGNFVSRINSRFESEVYQYGFDVGLRDTWKTGFGNLSAGSSFSAMGFQQNMSFVSAPAGSVDLVEHLDTSFLGGKLFVGWDHQIYGCPTSLGISLGLYEQKVDYSFYSQTLPGSVGRLESSGFASTVEMTLKIQRMVCDVPVSASFNIMYISDMPAINRDAPGIPVSPAFLGSHDAGVMSFLFEVLL